MVKVFQLLSQRMYSCGVKMIWIFLILSQLHVIYAFPAETIKNVETAAPPFPDLELIKPSMNFSPDLEKGNKKTHEIAESYRAKEPDVVGKSNISSDRVIIDHVTPDQQPPYGQPPMPPTEVEVFKPPIKPAEFPPSRPASFHSSRPTSFLPDRPVPYPPGRPGLYSTNNVEVFNPHGSLFPNVAPPPPSDARPILLPTNVADIEMVPFDKTAIKNKVEVDPSSNLYSTLDIFEESESSNSSYPRWNATKLYEDYERLLKFLDNLDSEESPADAVLSTLPESENVSDIANTESPAKSDIAPKEGRDFLVKIYHNPSKMCYHILRGDKYEESEKCFTFSRSMTSKANVPESNSSVDAENENHSSEIVYHFTNPAIKETNETLKSAVIEREASNEVDSADENASQSTPPTVKDTEFDRVAENLFENDSIAMIELIDQLLVENAANPTDSTEFLGAQETTTEKILLVEESTEVKNTSAEDSSAKSENGTESNYMLQNSTSDEILTTDATIGLSKDPIVTSTDKQMVSSEKFQAICRLLAQYFVDRMQIFNSKNVSGNKDFNEYLISPAVLPSPYGEPLIPGRSTDNSEELARIPDFVGFFRPEGNINSFDQSVLPTGAVNEANSGMYLVSQQSESMKSAESYSSLPEMVVIVPEFDGYV